MSSPALFSANYVAQFQQLLDSICIAQAPVIHVYCNGKISVTNTSDPTIVCLPSTTLSEFGQNYSVCTNTCADTACSDVYLNSGNYQDGPFGEIFFTCSGPNVTDANGAMSFEDSGPSQCAAASQARSFHFARLGVECPSVGTNSTSDTSFVFDDRYFECSLGSISDPADGNPGDLYTCFDGDACDPKGVACTTKIDQFFVNADSQWFQDICITPTLPITPAPSPGAVLTPTVGVQALFSASWALTFDALSGQACSANTPTISVNCYGSEIAFVNASATTISCDKIGNHALECKDSSDTFVNEFANVTYTCTGPTTPTTRVVYPENDAFCDSNTANATIRQNLQMAVYCNDASVLDGFYPLDFFFECGEKSSQFDKLNSFAEPGIAYTCSQSITIPSGSSPSDLMKVPAVSMETDPNWIINPISGCFKVSKIEGSGNSQTTNPSPTAKSPVQTTTSPSPTKSSVTLTTVSPSVRRPSTTISAPAFAPVQPTLMEAPSTPVPTSSADNGNLSSTNNKGSSGGGGNNTGVIIGGVLGSLVVVCLAGFLAIFWKSRRGTSDGEGTSKQAPPVGPGSAPHGGEGHRSTGGDSRDATSASGTGRTEGHGGGSNGYDEDIPVQSTASSTSGGNKRSTTSGFTSPTPYHAPPSSNASHNSGRGSNGKQGFLGHYPSPPSNANDGAVGTMPGAVRASVRGHDVNFKDQVRSFAVPVEEMPLAAGVVQAVPMPERQQYPLDTSDISDDRSSHTGRTRQSAEPDGRHAGVDL